MDRYYMEEFDELQQFPILQDTSTCFMFKESSLGYLGFDDDIFDSNESTKFSELDEEELLLSPIFTKASPILTKELPKAEEEEDYYTPTMHTLEEEEDSDYIVKKTRKKRGKKKRSLPMNQTCECSNCGTTNTPLWRRNSEGNPLCNACGLFFKLHGIVRPLCLKTDVIKKRNRSHSNTKKKKK